jgi:uncharacterized protein (DUF2141 family)
MKTILIPALPLAIVLATGAAASEPPRTGTLTVRVSALRSSRGQVGCTIYNSAKGFPTDPSLALQQRWCAIDKTESVCVFDPIPPGSYAVSCFHDENKNGKLDTGAFGIPTEGTTASNDAKGLMGPPTFDKAKFSFDGVASELSLRMGY